DGDLAASEWAGADVAKYDVGIGQSRLHAAALVARRAGDSAGASRPDVQAAGAVQEGDAAATGADLGDVDAGSTNDLPAPADEPVADRQGRPDLVLGAVADAAVLDEGCLGRRPAHVQGEDVAQAEPAGDEAGGQDPGSRAGFESEDRPHRRLGLRR